MLPGAPRPVDRAALERGVEFWHDDAGIRRRLEALAESSVDLVLFLEHVPRDLSEWLRAGQPADAACALLERDLLGTTKFLACCARFELAPDEARFLVDHALYDGGYVAADLVNWVVTALSDAGRQGWEPRVRNEFVRRCAEGMAVPELSNRAAAIVRHHAPTAVVVNDFHLALFGESRKTPYPKDELDRAIHRPAR
ncbi:MAG TPA: hypothetical protein VH333_19520 [Pseudonocardiaceae bacterium]|nr:hypothetical protein [Pseudonocardiaceae bacterium]